MGEDIVVKYGGQLSELKINSKPLINLLTMMAEDYIRHAPLVVQVIEKHLNTAKPEIKLPALYLIDSIIKNVKKDYVEFFTQNIVSSFCGVFEKVDEKTRSLLWKLRGTWAEHFPQKKLYAIDYRCHQIDPKWPITATQPQTGSIHVNPRFLNRGKAAALLNPEQIISQAAEVTTPVATPSLDDSVAEVQMRAHLLAKQKELLELQTKKVELELLQTKLQMEEKARRQKEEETVKQIDKAFKQEQLLVGIAEKAKIKTEKCQQRLFGLHKPGSSGVKSPSSKSSQHNDSSSDRESHSSTSPSKTIKTEGGSSGDGSSKKSKSTRDKSDRDRRDRSKNDKNSKDRHDKDKDSRHRHRDKSRHGEKDKKSSRTHEKSRDQQSASKTGGEWKDYNEANKASLNSINLLSEEDLELLNKDAHLMPLSSPTSIITAFKSVDVKAPTELSVEKNDLILPTFSLKPTLNASQSSDSLSVNSDSSSPLKRKLPKDKPSLDKDRRDKDKDKSDKNSDRDKEKPILSDPRLRRRNEKERNAKSEEKAREPSSKGSELKDYRERQEAVLRRSYRKNSGIKIKDELPNDTDVVPADVDLRFEANLHVDLRTESDGSGPEPPTKKSRSGKNAQRSEFDDLFGHQDVDLRGGSSCWTQVKSDIVDEIIPQDVKLEEERVIDVVLRSPGPRSSSPVATSRNACDPLGRPLIYNRLPNDPEERKRSLDSRSSSVDPIDQFRSQHIDRVLQSSGVLSEGDMKTICLKAKQEHDLGFLNGDQYVTVMKQILQVNEASAMREVQQMQQLKGDAWSLSNTPNPWVTEPEENNIWAGFGPTPPGPPRGPTDFSGAPRFPTNNAWDNVGSLPWISNNLPPAGPRGPNPFEEAIGQPMIAEDSIPKANEKELRAEERDIGRTIPIDKVVRQIRFYRETAIVLMGVMNDDPRELSFQIDELPRTVLINGKPLEVFLGETKKFDLNRVPHTLRIGTPGRELYIDDRPHEVFFGNRPIKVFLDGRPHNFQLLPPTPQVAVGQVPRFDLVAGKVNLTIDAVDNLPVYLDEKLQKIDILGEPVLLRFCNGFQIVILNGRPFPVTFGARLPFTITLPNGGKHYLRFGAIAPNTERAIQAFISASSQNDWNDAKSNHFAARRGRGGNNPTRGRGRARDTPMDRSNIPNPWVPDLQPGNTKPSNVNALDMLSSLFQNSSDNKNTADRSYESEQPAMEEDAMPDAKQTSADAAGPSLNVGDLVANLIKFGLLPSAASPSDSDNVEPAQEETAEELSNGNNAALPNKPVEQPISEPPTPVIIAKPKEEVKVIPPLPTVDVSFDSNLKERRKIAIAQIFTGVQCSQCGLRFPPDQTLRYSQHLDWHFRQNRREKTNARKALSRKWYYDMSDWIQFEEIEDLEERAASLFENQDSENDNEVKSPSAVLNPEDYTVLASSHEGAICPQCSEAFESYFDEEREEWRLKNARLDDCEGDQKLYHPICHEDYLKSLVEESILEENISEETAPEAEDKENEPTAEEEDDEVLIIKEGKKEIVVMEIDIDDDDVDKNDSVHVPINENPSIELETKTDNVILDMDCDIPKDNVTSDNVSLDCTNDSVAQSPILIDEDSNFLPGLCDDTDGGVFGFALNSTIRQEQRSPDHETENKIFYEPMKFDFPVIKVEPVDEDDPVENPDELMQNLQPLLPSTVAQDTNLDDENQPMNIDLTEEDSLDAVDSGARLVSQIRTSIDGNLQHEDAATLAFVPAQKIRINIFGMDTTPVGSPKDKPDSPQVREESNSETPNEALVRDDGNENVVSNNTEINKDNPIDPVLTEEVKRLKPRLVGRKLTNYPPKTTGTEESGLCVIC